MEENRIVLLQMDGKVYWKSSPSETEWVLQYNIKMEENIWIFSILYVVLEK
jgi:hypothetical protein